MSVSPRLLIVFLIMCTLMILPGCSFPGFKPRPSTPEQPAPKQGTYIAMLLPTSGSLGSITTKIMRGANLAASELRQKGQNVTVTLIGTSGNWQQKLSQLLSTPLSAVLCRKKFTIRPKIPV